MVVFVSGCPQQARLIHEMKQSRGNGYKKKGRKCQIVCYHNFSECKDEEEAKARKRGPGHNARRMKPREGQPRAVNRISKQGIPVHKRTEACARVIN